MTADELVASVRGRGGRLVLRDGRIRYYGPTLAADDPIRVCVREHRDELVRLLAPTPVRRFEPGPPYFERIGPNTWRETAWSAARCIYGDAKLAPGDRLHCPAHAAEYAAATGRERPEQAVRAAAASTAA